MMSEMKISLFLYILEKNTNNIFERIDNYGKRNL